MPFLSFKEKYVFSPYFVQSSWKNNLYTISNASIDNNFFFMRGTCKTFWIIPPLIFKFLISMAITCAPFPKNTRHGLSKTWYFVKISLFLHIWAEVVESTYQVSRAVFVIPSLPLMSYNDATMVIPSVPLCSLLVCNYLLPS